jgi:hypothetical protein
MTIKRALAWAEAGWPVFPCRPNKKPWFADWPEVATTNRKTIEKWWEHDTGDYYVGVLPAAANPSCFVLDVDVKGKDGFASLQELSEKFGFQPADFPSQETPSGGRHIFMRGEYPTSAGTFGAGLDTRGGLSDGTSRGYILAYGPPPVRPEECPIAPALPQSGRSKVAADRHEPIVEYDLGDNIMRAKKYLETVEPVGEGERNATLFKHVCALKDLGLSVDKCFEMVEEYPAVLGDPPIEDAVEIQNTIHSAFKNGQAAPGQAAVNPDTIARLVAEEAARTDVSSIVAAKSDTPSRLIFWPEIEQQAPPRWLVRGLIPDNGLVGLFGPGGSYKSFVALDLALSIATGQLEWAGREIRHHGPVVIVSGEGRLDNRALAWQKNHLPIGDRLAMIPGMDLSDAEDVENVAKAIKEAVDNVWFARPRVIVIDTLARASGSADENSSKDMGKVVAHCDALRRTFECTVILVHHTPKSGETWRGSTAVLFALDTALAIKGKNLKANLIVTRQKEGEVGHEWLFKLEKTNTGRVVDDEVETSLIITSAKEIVSDPAKERDKKERKEILRETNERGVRFVRLAVMRGILEGLPVGGTLGINPLIKQMAAELRNVEPSALRSWLKREVSRGEIDQYVVMREPLEFGLPKETASEVNS